MEIEYDSYACMKCKHTIQFDKGDLSPVKCDKCGNTELTFLRHGVRDPERGARIQAISKQINSHEVRCKYCNSPQVSKIGVVSRSLSFGLFGFGSSKIGANWHCNTCGSDF